MGIFGLESVDDLAARGVCGAIPPTQQQIDQPTEEWFCVFCVREDSIQEIDQYRHGSTAFFSVDEWGPSALVPWAFNGSYSFVPQRLVRDSPTTVSLFSALGLLCTSSLTSVFDPTRGNDVSSQRSWSLKHRVAVLEALCESMKATKVGAEVLENMYAECQKLSKINEKNSFREADFMAIVRSIAGDGGVNLCRSLLDGIENDDLDLHPSKIMAGRCLVCRSSTYEEDCADDKVILCDGCNGEIHLRCTSLPSVSFGSNRLLLSN